MSVESADQRHVVLCDHAGQPIGTREVTAAHQNAGQLHQAFSVFVFRRGPNGWELLIQQRAENKPLFAMKWANTCCSHPRPGETNICEAAERRLCEECGFTLPLRVAGTFVYHATDEATGGTEYEHDTVLVGQSTGDVRVKTDPREIAESKWLTLSELDSALANHESEFAPWFRPALKYALENIGAVDDEA